MRSRWYHAPTLHTAADHEKKVTWLELFYDLIFVASIIQLGDVLSHGVDDHDVANAVWQFTVHFAPLWIAWTGFTFYENRYNVDDFAHRTLVLLQMFAVGAMGVTAPTSCLEGGNSLPFAVATGTAHLLIALMHVRSWKHTQEGRDYAVYWAAVFAAAGLMWMGGALLPDPWMGYTWVAAFLMVVTGPMWPVSRGLAERFPLDWEHLSERYGLLTIIVLGESFVKVMSFLADDGHALEGPYMAKGAFNLLLICAVWWIYFDDIAGSKVRQGPFQWIVWLYGHLALAGSITAAGVAVKYAIKLPLWDVPQADYRYLLAGTLAATFLSVAAIDSATERRQADLGDAWRVRVRVVSALTIGLLGLTSGEMTGATLLGLIAAIATGQVLIDMFMAPMEEVAHMGEVPTAELARRHAAGEGAVPRVGDLSQTIRQGTPSHLRRDLYFFLMEGSWARLLVALVAGYVVLNVCFASLFLLQPDSITGMPHGGFFDAFSFSVQTMSTIGYGTMSPATPYGDTLVAIEAALGLLGVALATGLIFAKVSRPAARVLFTDKLVLTTWNGQPTLIFRAGNARGNEIVEANLSFSVLIDELTPEGHHMRRIHDLKLERERTPVFRLSWTALHVIDAHSPLHGIDWSSDKDTVMGFIAILSGHDATYAQMTHARCSWSKDDVHVGHHFVDVMSQLPDGRMLIDYDKFHDIEPDAAPAA